MLSPRDYHPSLLIVEISLLRTVEGLLARIANFEIHEESTLALVAQLGRTLFRLQDK